MRKGKNEGRVKMLINKNKLLFTEIGFIFAINTSSSSFMSFTCATCKRYVSTATLAFNFPNDEYFQFQAVIAPLALTVTIPCASAVKHACSIPP